MPVSFSSILNKDADALHTCNKGGVIESPISMSRVNDGKSHELWHYSTLAPTATTLSLS